MLPVVKERIEFLRQSEIAELVAAAAKHDAALYEMTHEEKAAGLDPATKRFKAITPFVKFVLLTGMRLNEAE
jgi:hypothetical protein